MTSSRAFLSITDQLDRVHGGQSADSQAADRQAADLEKMRNLGFPIKHAMILDANDPKHGALTSARCLSARVIDPSAPDTLYCLPDRAN